MTNRLVSLTIYWVVLIVAIFAIALHSPGQLSLDSVTQLYEASIGRHVSWFSPFMSALLRWLGGGTVGSSIFVCINICFTYGALAYSASTSQNSANVRSYKNVIRLLAILAILLNPVIFFYGGIVWKDVLLATAIVAALGLSLAGIDACGLRRKCFYGLAIVILSFLPLIRQQGGFLLLLLVPGPAILLVNEFGAAKKVARWAMLIFVIASSFGLTFIASKIVNLSIVKNDSREFSVGIHAIMEYAVIGMAREDILNVNDYLPNANRKLVDAIKESYSGERIDYMGEDPTISSYITGLGSDGLKDVFFEDLKNHPLLYAQHRIDVFSWLLGFHGVNKCLPIHVGISGNPSYLEKLGLTEIQDERAQFIYKIAHPMFKTLLFRHYFYAGLLIIMSMLALRIRRSEVKILFLFNLLALWAFLASFVIASLACDFRYLYPIIPALSCMLIYVLRRPELFAHLNMVGTDDEASSPPKVGTPV